MPLSQCHKSTENWKTVNWSSWETVFLDIDPAAIAQTELRASVFVLLQSVSHHSQMIWLKFKPSHAILLLKILQWLSIVIRIKTKTLNMGQAYARFAPAYLSSQLPTPLCPSYTAFFRTLFPHDFHMLLPLFGIIFPLFFTKLAHALGLS